MLKAVPVDQKLAAYEEIHRLYDASFPDNERIPWQRLISQMDENRQMLAWFDDDILSGLSYTFRHGKIVYLGYLAVEEALRDRGYGSEILKMLRSMYAAYKIVIDIEVVDEEADNFEERKKRRDFYLKNGFEKTGTGYYFWYVDYELLSANGIVTAQEYRDLILAHWGPIAERAVFKTL